MAAGGHVEVMQDDGIAKAGPFAQHGRDVPAVGLAAKRLDREAFERQARKNDHPVIALLPVERHVLVAQALETLERKAVVGALGLLQTEDVGPHRLDESRYRLDAQPHRIDVPRRDRQPHRMSGGASVAR